jgi:hypothetical protein
MPALRLRHAAAWALFVSACAGHGPVAPLHAGPAFRCFVPPRIAPVLPSEVAPFLDQDNVDCFAWQELVALGWPASPKEPGAPDTGVPASRFGAPGERRPMVFQTYRDVSDVFLPGARAPAPWSARPDLRGRCGDRPDDALVQAVAEGAPLLEDTTEAGATTPAWLTAQSGKNVYFEIRVNRDIFEYVRREGLYDATRQLAAVRAGGPGIGFPAGQTAYGHEGAVDIKAAWLEIGDDPRLAARYATTRAVLRDPDRNACRLARMGLVGLHISHKTGAAQQWTWATFEHEDNAPDRLEVERGVDRRARYTFYDPACAPASAPRCQPNRKPECAGGGCDPRTEPVAVVREVPLTGEARRTNEAMSRVLAEESPGSVWRHYRLIDVMWPGCAEVVPPGREAPLTHGGAQPPLLANTTMETYLQTGTTRKNCLDCHADARIAPTAGAPAPTWATDYSFILQRACDPTEPSGHCHPGNTASGREAREESR